MMLPLMLLDGSIGALASAVLFVSPLVAVLVRCDGGCCPLLVACSPAIEFVTGVVLRENAKALPTSTASTASAA